VAVLVKLLAIEVDFEGSETKSLNGVKSAPELASILPLIA
jgi:hypothetical protein